MIKMEKKINPGADRSAARAGKKKEEDQKKEGEVFYKAHSIAQPAGRVARRETGVSVTVERVLWRILGIVEVI